MYMVAAVVAACLSLTCAAMFVHPSDLLLSSLHSGQLLPESWLHYHVCCVWNSNLSSRSRRWHLCAGPGEWTHTHTGDGSLWERGAALVWLVTGGGYSTCGNGLLAQPGTVDQRGPVRVSVQCRSIDTCTVHLQLNIAAV